MYNKELYKTLKQWELQHIEILEGDETHLCDLCNLKHVKFVYVMSNKHSSETVRVGCVCAIYLEYGKEDKELISKYKKEYKKKENELIKKAKEKKIEEAKQKEKSIYLDYIKKILKEDLVKNVDCKYRDNSISGVSFLIKTQYGNLKAYISINEKRLNRNIYITTNKDIEELCFFDKKFFSFYCEYKENLVFQQRGCGQKVGLFYDTRPRLLRYSRGLLPPKDILIRFSLYQ